VGDDDNYSNHRSLVVAALLQLAAGAAFADDLRNDPRVKKGFEIATSQHIQLDEDRPSQGLGSYLVTVSSCNDCHTQPNFTPTGDPTVRGQAKQVNINNYLAGDRFSHPG
jgi:hypothetical protein